MAFQARSTVLSAAASAATVRPINTAVEINLARHRPGTRLGNLAATKGVICWWLVCGFTCLGPRAGPRGAGETQFAAGRPSVLPLRGKRSSEIADSGEGSSEVSRRAHPPHPELIPQPRCGD